MFPLSTLRHSFAHVLAAAVNELYPGQVLFAIGPDIDHGFYYDLDFTGIDFREEMLADIEKKMRSLMHQKLRFDRFEVSVVKAIETLRSKGEVYKAEMAEELKAQGETMVSFYRMLSADGKEIFVDMCRGPHVDTTGDLPLEAFSLQKIAGAYWRGDAKNKMLTRIYGLAFETKAELAAHVTMLEEAKKRDHRELGKKLDLFHIDDKVGLGLPLWHPRGAMLWRKIEDFWYQEHVKNGYDLVRSPHIGNRTLWETSGHWGFYSESMYPALEAGQTLKDAQQDKKAEVTESYLLKPMNCPFHVQIYKHHPHSYREFPMRWAECGTVYRFEKKWELSGLTRVRGFTQDDAHIMCRADQVEDELKRVVDFILFMYRAFGFDVNSVQVFLSLRDPKHKDQYAWSDEGWDFTQNVLRKVAQEKGLNFKEEEGEAAFYGPKLDFKIKDCIGRLWQCSTLQFDFNLPERFDMNFINKEGVNERPYVLHRALFGSFERFIGLLIEHYAGAFPLWITPEQMRILPVSDAFLPYAEKAYARLKSEGFRVTLDDANESLGKKIRSAEQEKVNYALIIGEKEVAGNLVAVRNTRTKEQVTMDLEAFVVSAKQEVEERKI